MTEEQYEVTCWHCLADFEAVAAVWCSCSPTDANKICPFCLKCLCAGGREAIERFWLGAPDSLKRQRSETGTRRLPLGDLLVAAGRITEPQLETALDLQRRTGRRLGDCLVELGSVTTSDLDRLLGEQQAPIAFDLGSRLVEPELCRRVGVTYCLENRLLPLERTVINDQALVILVMADPSRTDAVEQVRKRLDARVIIGKVPEAEIVDLLSRLFPGAVGGDEQSGHPDLMVQALLQRALGARASHLQLKERPTHVDVLWAVDGFLHPAPDPGEVQSIHVDALMARFKDIAGGGGLRLESGKRRALAYPHVAGDAGCRTVTVRFFEIDELRTSIEALDMDRDSRFTVKKALAASSGLIILTGSAGSGGDLTFWSFLNEIALAGRQIALFNAPLAHPAENIHEGPVAVGSALENAPEPLPESNWDIDVLALYHCADPGLLHRSVREARRRLVVLRMPAADASEAIERLGAAGVSTDLLAARLALVVEQTAVRRICPGCLTWDADETGALAATGQAGSTDDVVEIFRGKGCDECGVGSGYRGRVLVIQILPAGPGLTRALEDASTDGIRRLPRAHGQATPDSLCIDLLRRGITTPEEIREGARSPSRREEPDRQTAPRMLIRRERRTRRTPPGR